MSVKVPPRSIQNDQAAGAAEASVAGMMIVSGLRSPYLEGRTWGVENRWGERC